MTETNLTENQQALLRELTSGRKELVSCVGGFAAWDRDASWSQGRTPSNAISAKDINALLAEGYIETCGFGSLCLTLKAPAEQWRKVFVMGGPAPLAPLTQKPWLPANEGYTGPALT